MPSEDNENRFGSLEDMEIRSLEEMFEENEEVVPEESGEDLNRIFRERIEQRSRELEQENERLRRENERTRRESIEERRRLNQSYIYGSFNGNAAESVYRNMIERGFSNTDIERGEERRHLARLQEQERRARERSASPSFVFNSDSLDRETRESIIRNGIIPLDERTSAVRNIEFQPDETTEKLEIAFNCPNIFKEKLDKFLDKNIDKNFYRYEISDDPATNRGHVNIYIYKKEPKETKELTRAELMDLE